MADVSVKMGVSGLAEFKQGMSQANASVKALDSALKLNEKQLKANGDAEAYMQQKTTLLNQKLDTQKKAVSDAEKALKAMKDSGVDPLSTSYQNMQKQLLDLQSAMLDTENDIRQMGQTTAEAAGKADKLGEGLAGLNRKVSLDQVLGAINSITSGMERGAQAAINLGKQIWENITDSARYADDIAAQAMTLNMDVEEYQKLRGALLTVGEITVQEWQKAKQKVQKAINDPSADQIDVLAALGIQTHEILPGKLGDIEGAARNYEEVFWEIGQRLREKVASGELTQDMADLYSNAIFGKTFAGLNNIFALGEEGFKAEMKAQAAASAEAIEKNAKLNDSLITLQNSYNSVKEEITSGLAPALTAAADTLNGLLNSVLDYLKTPEGQQALEKMGDAVEKLFGDLGNIDPEQVVQNFSTLFNTIIEKFQWLADHWNEVKIGLEGIAGAFALMKVSSGVLEFFKLMQGAKGIFGGGGGGSTAGSAAAGAAGGGIIAGIQSAITGAAASIGSAWASAGASMTAGPVADWFMYQTDVGRFLRGEETWDDVLKSVQDFGDSVKENAATFQEDWAGLFDEIGKALGWKKDNGNDREEIVEDVNLDNEPLINLSPSQWEAAERFWDAYRESAIDAMTGPAREDLYNQFQWTEEEQNNFRQLISLMESLKTAWYGGEDLPDWWVDRSLWPQDEPMEIPAEPVLTEGGEKDLQEILDGLGLMVPVSPYFDSTGFNGMPWLPHANGLNYVPFDGYPALLHKGERVMSSREVESRSYNSNLYVESMVMNNGQDAEGLAAAMAAAQRRTSKGYGG